MRFVLALLFVATLVTGRPTAAVAAASVRAAIDPGWGTARFAERDGTTVLLRDGRPFFVDGAAFFYARMPRATWAPAMDRLRALGINTLDLYVPWNWHELADGDFDFDGRTNPRRDLREVLRLARERDFALIVRPGPVIRNEWRGGGYPAWLLARPAYAMPLHDLLEGRYPPIATLQNAHSDDAAAAWLANADHVAYARRWLVRALAEFAPVANLVLAVALDDDQGAYIDNQTYPAPNLRRYLDWLAGIVRGATSPSELVFINTYQMKVPVSSPVWTMGNWYQSDAEVLGEHDRAQLELSFGMLATRPDQPLLASEFQAGWLQGAGEAYPRAAAPENTALALATMVGAGVRGVVNFPAQDTLAPAGWEAPFSNAFYAWNAALRIDGSAAPRARPVASFGALVRAYGPALASSAPRTDLALAYLGGSFEPAATTNAVVAAAAAALERAQGTCRAAGLACSAVDPRAVDAAALARRRVLVVPVLADAPPLLPTVARAIAAARARGLVVLSGAPDVAALRVALRRARRVPSVLGIPGATFAPDPTGMTAGFLSLENYGAEQMTIAGASIARCCGAPRAALPAFVLPAHTADVLPIDVRIAAFDGAFASYDTIAFATCALAPAAGTIAGGRLALAPTDPERACDVRVAVGGIARAVTLEPHATLLLIPPHLAERATLRVVPPPPEAPVPPIPDALEAAAVDATLLLRPDAPLAVPTFRPVPPGDAIAYRADVFADGKAAVVLDDGLVRLVVAPDAGGRAFALIDDRTGRNVFTTVGAMRDDVAIEPPRSTSDRIAAYTHDFPAGTFNRPYRTTLDASAGVARATLRYVAPDVVPAGATFERVVSLQPGARAVTLSERFMPEVSSSQRAVSVSSIAVGDGPGDATRVVFAPDPRPLVAGEVRDASGEALGLYDRVTHELATIAWHPGDVERAQTTGKRGSLVVRLTLAPERSATLRFGSEIVLDPGTVPAALASAAAAAGRESIGRRVAHAPPEASGRVGKWRNGRRDRLKSG